MSLHIHPDSERLLRTIGLWPSDRPVMPDSNADDEGEEVDIAGKDDDEYWLNANKMRGRPATLEQPGSRYGYMTATADARLAESSSVSCFALFKIGPWVTFCAWLRQLCRYKCKRIACGSCNQHAS